MKSLRITKVWTFLLVYLLAGMAGTTESLVICLGTQGHVGIEVAGLNQSCDGPCDIFDSNTISKHSSINAIAPGINICGPCVDIPILTSISGQQSQQLRPSENFSNSQQDRHAALLSFSSAITFPVEKVTGKNILSSSHSTIDSTITSLRTVISFLV